MFNSFCLHRLWPKKKNYKSTSCHSRLPKKKKYNIKQVIIFKLDNQPFIDLLSVMSLNSQPFKPSLYADKCLDCGKQRTATSWCKNCDVATLRENFRYWTSGNPKINEFIRHTQLNADENTDYLEWIDFEQFELLTLGHGTDQSRSF